MDVDVAAHAITELRDELRKRGWSQAGAEAAAVAMWREWSRGA